MSPSAGSRFSIDAALLVSDFPDRLSPIFVRDLRRILRERVFAGGFLALQILALLAALLEWLISTAMQNIGGGGAFPGVFTLLTSLVFQLFLPLTFFNSLQAELGGRNVELLLTSRLSPWQIVRGKFLAASALCGLVLASLLPYYLIRYFLGGVDFTPLLVSLAYLFFHNALMNAIMIGASAYSGPAVRVLIILFLIFASSILIDSNAKGLPYGGLPALKDIAIRGASFALFIVLALQIGKAKLSPPGWRGASTGTFLTLILILLAVFNQLTAPIPGFPGAIMSPVALAIILACALVLDRGNTLNNWCLLKRRHP